MENIRDLKDWQWMMLFQGVLILPLGIITLLFLEKITNVVQCKSS